MQIITAVLAFAVSAMAFPPFAGTRQVPPALNPTQPFLLLVTGENVKNFVSADQDANIIISENRMLFTVDENQILRTTSGDVATIFPGSLGIYLARGDVVPSGYAFEGYSIEEGTGRLKFYMGDVEYGFQVCDGNRLRGVRLGDNVGSNCVKVEILSSFGNSQK